MSLSKPMPQSKAAAPTSGQRVGSARASALTPVASFPEDDGEIVESKDSDQDLSSLQVAANPIPRMRAFRTRGNRSNNKIETFRIVYDFGRVSTNGSAIISTSFNLATFVLNTGEYTALSGLFDMFYLESLTAKVVPIFQPGAALGGAITSDIMVMAVDWDAAIAPSSVQQVYRYDNSWVLPTAWGSGRVMSHTWTAPKSRVELPWATAAAGVLGSFFIRSQALGTASTPVVGLLLEGVLRCRQRI